MTHVVGWTRDRWQDRHVTQVTGESRDIVGRIVIGESHDTVGRIVT